MNGKNSAQTYREMYLQPESFRAINETLPDIFRVLDQVFSEKYDEIIFTGCGTSLYLAQTAAFVYSKYTGMSAKGVPCSELYYFPECFAGNGKKVLVLPITRKSYTTEVRMAIDKMHTMPGVKSLAITCDQDSRLYNDFVILSPEAAEDSVIMTRSFTSMVYLSVLMAMYAGGKKDETSRMADGYVEMSKKILESADAVAGQIISEHPELNLYITLGQGENYGIANECMNKMKEMGIANSEAYYSLEYRHGPMSLVDENTLVIMLANDATTELDAKLMSQMKEYGAVTLAVGEEVTKSMSNCDYFLNFDFGKTSIEYAAVTGFIGQFIGYYIAESKKIDADSPRHLSQAIVLQN